MHIKVNSGILSRGILLFFFTLLHCFTKRLKRHPSDVVKLCGLFIQWFLFRVYFPIMYFQVWTCGSNSAGQCGQDPCPIVASLTQVPPELYGNGYALAVAAGGGWDHASVLPWFLCCRILDQCLCECAWCYQANNWTLILICYCLPSLKLRLKRTQTTVWIVILKT